MYSWLSLQYIFGHLRSDWRKSFKNDKGLATSTGPRLCGPLMETTCWWCGMDPGRELCLDTNIKSSRMVAFLKKSTDDSAGLEMSSLYLASRNPKKYCSHRTFADMKKESSYWFQSLSTKVHHAASAWGQDHWMTS